MTEDPTRSALGEDSLPAEHDHPIDEIEPQPHAVFDDEHGRLSLGLHGKDGITDAGRGRRIDIGRRLVEDDDLRRHRMDAGQSQTLLLPAGQRRTRMLGGQVESHGTQRRGNPSLDGLGGQTEVLHPEGDIVADAGEDHLRIGILQDQSGAASARIRSLAADEELTAGLAGLLGQDAGDGMEQSRLAGPRGAEEEDLLTRGDVDVEGPDSRCIAIGMRPRVSACRDRQCHQRRRPEANELSAPVAAIARYAYQAPMPERTRPETMAHTA